MPSRAASSTQSPPIPAGLTRAQLLEIYRYLRLTRTLEERLTALYRQSKVIGGLFRSLGQEGESVASAYALERGRHKDFLSPLIRNLGSMLVMGAEPIQILRQYMAKATSPSGGRARGGEGVQFLEVVTYRRKGHAEHDDQRYVPPDEIERWARENDPIDRYMRQLLERGWADAGALSEIDAETRAEIDAATDAC